MAESFYGRHAKIISGQPLIYGQSITDPCLNWEDTEVLLKTCRGGRQPLLIARPSCRDGRFFDALPALFLSARVYHSAELALAVIALIIDNNNHCEFDY